MKTLESSADLSTFETTKVLTFTTRYLVQEHFTFSVTARSGEFSGVSGFCSSKTDIAAFSEQLKIISSSLTGTARILDYDSDSYIEITGTSNGHISVSGLIGGTHTDQYLRFTFDADQTSLGPFIQAFDQLQSVADR